MNTTIQLQSNTVKTLQKLISLNNDSRRGYETAMEQTEDPRLTEVFTNVRDRRSEFSGELSQFLEDHGFESTDSGTVLGDAHRWWLKARTFFSNNDRYAVLAEAERSEDVIKDAYEKALTEVKDPDAVSLLTEQFVRVKQTHDMIRDKRDASKKLA